MNRTDSHPVLTCAEAKAWEQRILADESREWTAMQTAGSGIALSILADYQEIGGLPAQARLLVLAGKGNNGGDALLVARTILLAYPEVRAVIILCFGAAQLRPLARRALDALHAAAPGRVEVVVADAALGAGQTYALCVDGIFGYQFRAPMDPATAQLLTEVNNHAGIKFRAAIDLPSGVAETSAATVFRADFTYAAGIVKTPLLQPANAAAVGRLRYVDIGFFKAEGVNPNTVDRVLLPSILEPLTELRPSLSDKRTYGHLCVVGGSHSYPGAVMLAVRAALRSGAGLVTAFVPEKFAPEYAATHPEVMWVGCPVTASGGLAPAAIELIRARTAKASAMLIGPGLAADPATITLVGQIVDEAKIPLVLDADALRPEVMVKVLDKPFICTPHAGEFARIKPALFDGDRLVAAQAVLVLKGPLTRVTDGQTSYYSPFGGPVLARGGSGDMLAGLTGGLLAQQPADPLLAACRGVVWHGLAADLLARTRGQVTVETSELLEQLGPALKSTLCQTH
jgi:NAD(P)H-hydrate epimerase